MRIMFLVLISMASFVNDSFCNNINPNMEYVWARSGLNVRSGPGTSYDIIEKLVFGDSVLVISDTDVTYNISGISNVDSTQHYFTRCVKIGAYILYGKWVEIYTPGGKFGYVIDQYLMKIGPNITDVDKTFIESSRDTISLYGVDESYETFISLTFKNGVKGSVVGSSACYGENYTLEGYTIQEAFVMLFPNNVEFLKVTKNWPNELKLSDGWMNEYSFIVKDGVVYYSFMACC